jgi:hypothetical protein
MMRVLPQCGQRAGGLAVCGTRWACASEVAIREAMAALYHALGASRILEGLTLLQGSAERGEGVGCHGARERQKINKNAPGIFHGLLKLLP